MKEIFKEYGTIILAVTGGLLIIFAVGRACMAENSPMAKSIEAWGTEVFE